ncbi:hypothetical protein PENSPDRAFT_673350 [Peniophora sp. CONT]|nr:hypothetical protein PENSPDRAFT_673350 [Peniophora sp. CONT]
MFSLRALAAAFLVASAAAADTFSVLAPGGPNVWWVAESQNTLTWTCHTNPPAQVFQLLLNNTNVNILPSPMAILANLNNADCSHTITTQQAALTPSTGYTIVLADQLDQTKIYATSQEFEVKALGATYPAASATPTEGGSSASATGSATGSAASGAASSTASASSESSNSSGAMGLTASIGSVFLAAGALLGML